VENTVAEEQAGFRIGRGTVDHLFLIRQLAEKYCEKNHTLYNNFIDFKQAFDSVWQKECVAKRALASTQELRDPRGSCSTAGRPVQQINECSQSGWFRVTVGVRHGCNLSPYLFNLLLESLMSVALKTVDTGVN